MRTSMFKRLRPETREAAKAAARRAGQSVEEWLDTIVAQSAQSEFDDEDDDSFAVQERLDELTRRIDRLTAAGPAAYAPLRPRSAATETDELAKVVARLDRRLDQFVQFAHAMPSLLAQQQQQPPGVDRALAEITARQRALRGETAPAAPAPAVPPLPPMPAMPQHLSPRPAPAASQAMAAKVDAQYAHAAGYAPPPTAAAPPPPPPPPPLPPQMPLPAPDMSGLERQLRAITNQIETLRKPGVEEAINSLRSELGQIAQALTEALPRHVIDAVEAQIQTLARRLSEGRQAGVGEDVLASIERHLGELREALRALTPAEHLIGFNETVSALAQRLDQIVAQRDPVSFHQLEDAVNNLRAISAHIASNEAVGQLAAQLDALSAKVDQIAYTSSGDAALAHLEERISALADALSARSQNGAAVPQRLEKLVGSLAEKIEQIQSSRGEGLSVGHLEERIVRLAEKLDASDSRLANLEAVERGLADLLAQADQAARERHNEQAAAGTEQVDALRRDVARTQDSLEAVHGTLGKLVDRLAAIEQGIRERPQPAPAAPLLQQPVDAVVAQVVAAASQIQAQAHQAEVQTRADGRPAAAEVPLPLPAAEAPPLAPAQPAAQQPRTKARPPLPPRRSQPIDPDLPPDHPIEPGMVKSGMVRPPRAAAGTVPPPSPAARIAASEAALGPAKPPVIPDPAGQSDFIAAARRAAKAAEQAPAPPIPPQPPRLDLAFDAVPADAEPPRSAFGAARPSLLAALRRKLKSLLIASSVVAIVVGGYYIIGSVLDGKNAAIAPTPDELLQGKTGAKPASEPPPGLYEDPEPELENQPAENPASGGGSGYKLLAPDSTLQNAPGLAPEPPKPDKPDVTGSIGRGAARVVYPDKLPAAIGSAGLREAALRGDAGAAYEIAIRYADGQGVARSAEEAARWFERAAGKGVALAQFRLGSMYEKGNGVRRDLKEARRLYGAAAEQGHAKAMHNLAVLYAEGIDGRPDYKTAAHWFQKAAGYGVPDSQYNLGILHARGLGLEKNLSESYKWFSLAAAQGDKEAAKKRDEIGARLEADARAAAETAVKTWVPQLQPQQAIRAPAPAGGWDQSSDGVASKETAKETSKETAKETARDAPRETAGDAARPRTAARAPMRIIAQ